MITTNSKTAYTKDAVNKKMTVVREFAAPVKTVWAAWTEKELLDKWWGPKPWKVETKSQDFRDGGTWLYSMNGPNGEKHWSRADYSEIVPLKSFKGKDCFCDENGNKNNEFPSTLWKNEFESTANGTKVTVNITFDSEEDLQKMIEMGFEEGFATGHDQLDELLKTLNK